MIAVTATGVERPEDKIVSLYVRRDGIAVVTVDDARHAENPITMGLQAQLAAAIVRIEEDASIAGVVLASGKPSAFVSGFQAALLTSIKFATDGERVAAELSHTLCRLEGLRKPVVAAVHGPALGGGFELALACHAIVASDDPTTVFGLPEVSLGLVPAANGELRVANRAGLRVALDVALSGENLRAEKARALGLVDDVCCRAILIDAAIRHAKALVGHVPRIRDERADFMTLAIEDNRLGRRYLFRRARQRVRCSTHRRSAAHLQLIDILERFAAKGFDEAARLEARVFGELVVTETAHRLIEFSVAIAALEHDSGTSENEMARPAQRIALLGAGWIGGGIAYVSISSGMSVRIKEKDIGAGGRGLRHVRSLLDASVAKEQLAPLEADCLFGDLSATTDFSGLRNAHAVIEAVPEDLALKQEILGEVEALIDPSCVYASTTFALPISKIARAASNPERVLGVHYFSPVPSTGLLEVVRAEKTESWAVATIVAIGKRQRKTVIVVKDGPGFYTTRILVPWLNEAVQLLSEGVPIQAIDEAMVDWGFSIGPMQQLDEMGIDVASQVAQGLHAALGARMTPPGALAAMAADDRQGKKNGRGLYRYDTADHARKRRADTSVYPLVGVEPRTKLPVDEIQMRCTVAMVNEALRCLGDGVLRDPRDGDVGAVLGLGFPKFRGGPFRYIDTIGAADVLRRVHGYADRFGDRWRPAPLLVQMAKKGDRFFR